MKSKERQVMFLNQKKQKILSTYDFESSIFQSYIYLLGLENTYYGRISAIVMLHSPLYDKIFSYLKF